MGGETENEVSGWTVDTAMAHMQRQLDDLRRLQDERMTGSQRANEVAFEAARTAVAAALLSAEKAVAKAENAAERRFDSVNEFRAQLSDQAATFISRKEDDARQAEVHARLDAILERLNLETGHARESVTDVENRLGSRLDNMAGEQAGALAATNARRAQTSQMIAILSVVLISISVAVAIILGFNK